MFKSPNKACIPILGRNRMENINRILVNSGATKYCQKAIHYGAELARKFDAELYVIHVIHNPFGYEGFNLPMISLDDAYKSIIQEAREDLDRIAAEEKTKGLQINILLKEGEPEKEIINVISEKKIDLLVMLAHEESRLEHLESRIEKLIFGKSNEELLRKMPCHILLVKN
jgi:universal stress protein A